MDTRVVNSRVKVFLHVPKTAGTTLNSIFANHLEDGQRYKLMMRGMSYVRPRFSLFGPRLISRTNLGRFRAALAEPGKLKVIDGHFDMSIARFMPEDAFWITLLRDPVERAISHYRHYRALEKDPMHRTARENTLLSWVMGCNLVEMDNGQTRRLAGAMDAPIGSVDDRMLETAKRNLAKFDMVGLSERFDAFQVLLHAAMGWPLQRYPACNVGKSPVESMPASESDRSVLRAFNRYDDALYEFAHTLFERSIANVDMPAALKALQAAPVFSPPHRAAGPAASSALPCSRLALGAR